MKVYTKVVIDMNTDEVLEEESYEYSGPVAKAGGGSSSSGQEVWEGLQPYYTGGETSSGEDVTGLYDLAYNAYNDANREYYTGQQVANLTEDQQAAIAGIEGLATGDSLSDASSQVSSTLAGDYYGSDPSTSFYETAMAGGGESGDYWSSVMGGDSYSGSPESTYLSGIAEGQDNVANSYYTKTAEGDYLNSTPTSSYYESVLGGEYLDPESNTALSSYFDSMSDDITEAYNDALADTASTYESSGRYGSGSYEEAQSSNAATLADSLSALASDTYYQAYESERDRQTESAADYGSEYQSERGYQEGAVQGLADTDQAKTENILSAVEQLGGRYTTDADQKASAAQALADYQTTGATGLSDAYQLERDRQTGAVDQAIGLDEQSLANYQAYLDASGLQYDVDQANLDVGYDEWYYNQNREQELLDWLGGIYGGTNTGTASSQSSGMDGGDIAAIIAAAMSSSKFKKNIKEVENPEKVLELNPVEFEWNHNGEKDVGFIAEEVKKTLPEAVAHTKDGEVFGLKLQFQMQAMIVGMLKKLNTRIDKLEARA